jgi:hypothetical protein
MITFYGEVALATLTAYIGACWLISKLPSSPKRSTKHQVEQDHGLHGSNRDRAINQSFNWR